MSNDPKNPISNETGEYLQHVAQGEVITENYQGHIVEAPQSDAKPVKKSTRRSTN